ncbi:MAG TPA: 50S ribosomal protein L25 [Candidatus Marinimicrobia bacterium]|nr:50S ribosomal protein L25 [Candidatus Neomarinimicrobiota bacterium]
MPVLTLNAQTRSMTGKNANGRLRRSGQIPAVFYKKDEEAQVLSVERLDLQKVLKSGNQIVDLLIGSEPKKVLIRDIQYHPVTEDILHIDFLGVSLDDVITLEVPLHFTGTPIGVRSGGVMDAALHQVRVKCQVRHIPHTLEIDVAGLKMGKSIHIRDLSFENIQILNNMENLVITVNIPRGMQSELEEESTEAEE